MQGDLSTTSYRRAKSPKGDRVLKSASFAATGDMASLGQMVGDYDKIWVWTEINRKLWWEWPWNPQHSEATLVICDHRLNCEPHAHGKTQGQKGSSTTQLVDAWSSGVARRHHLSITINSCRDWHTTLPQLSAQTLPCAKEGHTEQLRKGSCRQVARSHHG